MKTQKKSRNTRQKKLILQILKASTAHPTADELFFEVRREMPNLSLATVYRNLAKLESEEQIQSLQARGGQRRYDGCEQPHLHIRCRQCNRVVDTGSSLPPLELITQLTNTGAGKDFVTEDYYLELIGQCSACRPKKVIRNKTIIRNKKRTVQ